MKRHKKGILANQIDAGRLGGSVAAAKIVGKEKEKAKTKAMAR